MNKIIAILILAVTSCFAVDPFNHAIFNKSGQSDLMAEIIYELVDPNECKMEFILGNPVCMNKKTKQPLYVVFGINPKYDMKSLDPSRMSTICKDPSSKDKVTMDILPVVWYEDLKNDPKYNYYVCSGNRITIPKSFEYNYKVHKLALLETILQDPSIMVSMIFSKGHMIVVIVYPDMRHGAHIINMSDGDAFSVDLNDIKASNNSK